MYEKDTLLEPSDLEELRSLEESLWIGETRYNSEIMEQCFAPDFIEFGRSGKIYSRAEMLFTPETQTEILATIPLPDFRARHLSPDIVQITYISEVRYGDTLERANRSSIWSRFSDGWKLRFHQGTVIDPA